MSFLKLIPTWVYWMLGVLVAVAAVAGVIAVLLQRAKKKKEDAARAALPPGAPEDPSTQIPHAFDAGRKILSSKVTDKTTRDAIPRLLVIGEPGSGKTTLLSGCGLGTPFGSASEPPVAEPAAARLFFFDSGVAIDTAGAIVLGDMGKREPDAPHFKTLLRQLKKDRPGRPLDGLLVTIPCRDLLPSSGSTPEDRKRKATILHKRILELQIELGMAVPVYVVVTQCDLITGFSSFGNEVSSMLQASMLGWSSPAEPGSDKVVDWVDESFASVHESLVKEQSRRFASEGPVRYPDSYFLFPSELNGIADPLRAYIDEIFLPTAFEERLMMRGLYFCGDVNATTLMTAPASAPVAPGMPQPRTPTLAMEALDVLPGGGAGPQILFVKDLFAKKIFAEANIGRPSANAVKARNRGILAIQIAAVALSLIFAAAITITSERLARDAVSLMPSLSFIENALKELPSQKDSSDLTGAKRIGRSREMLRLLAGIEANQLKAVFIPGSWFSSIDTRIEGAIAAGYDRIVLNTYGKQLDAGIKDLVVIKDEDTHPLSAELEIPLGTPLEKTPEFIRLEKWLQEIGTFEDHARRFNGLAEPDEDVTTKDIQDVAALAEYTLLMPDEKGRLQGYKVKPEFFTNSKYYREALNDEMTVAPFSFTRFQADARAKSDLLFDRLYERMLDIYQDDAIRRLLESLKQGLDALEKGGDDYKVDQLRALHADIVRTEELLAGQNLAWVASSGLPESAGVTRLLQAVRDSTLLGPNVHDPKKEMGEAKLLGLKERLKSAQVESMGQPILAHDKDGSVQMKLNPIILGLKDPLKALLSQGFMTGDDGSPPPEDRDREVITWNVEVLKDTAKLPKQYEEFNANGGFKPFPDSARDTILALALRKLNAKVLGGVNRAIERAEVTPSDNPKVREAIARSQIANYAQAGGPFREILVAFGRLQQGTTTTRLRGLISAQGTRLLILAWNVFTDPEPYRIKQGSFGWWDGEGVPVFEAFDVADAAGLAERMVAQRVRVDTLGKELADPVLGVLESGEVGASTNIESAAVAWHDVVNPMRDYETQKPGNSVSALERFLLSVMPTITFENCLVELEKVGGDTSKDDFFTRKRASIRRLLRERCEYLAKDNVADKYASLRRIFTRSLAERFPFSKNEKGVRREDAAPDATKKFLEDSFDFRRRYRGFLKARGSASDREVVRFLDKMENVRAFLLPMWGQSESAVDGVFDVRVDFRVNQAREVGGNQIAEWRLRFGQEKLFLGDNRATPARWRLNDTVYFDLRWAKNGPNVPKSDRESGVVVKPQTKVAVFEEYGVWALLRLIASHQTTLQDVIGKADTSAHVLGFEVPTEPDNTGGFLDRVGTDPGMVRVFIRMNLAEADKDKPLKYPEFPTFAPAL